MAQSLADLCAALASTYTIDRELGRGGMATVYLAHDLRHDRPVALKVLHPDLGAVLGAERFAREIRLAARLQHPHILSVYDSGQTPDGQLWFTMPYVEGETVRARLAREHQLPIDQAVRIASDAAQALQYAHEHGVVHRDIKPENLLLTKDGSVLVADFGIARGLGSSEAGATPARLTETGLVVGTPAYMSPEQASGERDIGPASDVYSLAAVLYEMLAGEPPFTGATAQAVVAKMLSGEAPSVRRPRAQVPEAVDAAIRKALSPVPADRFASAGDFARALTSALATTARPSPRRSSSSVPAPKQRRMPTSFALLIVGVLLGSGALFAWRKSNGANGGNGADAANGPVSLAVLPFENAGDTANAYFADGITGEIRGKLSGLPSLRVIATTSSNQYRHTTKSPEQIGRELGVRYLLTGTVEWEGGQGGVKRVRVSPELVLVGDGKASETKWRQSFDTTLADVFAVQSAVASRVADRLGIVLSAPTQTQLAQRPTENIAAYEAYLRSMALSGQDPPTLRRAVAAAEQAVALDSNFAAAWAKLSSSHSILYANSIASPAESAAAIKAAERAVALAPNAADGYVARGMFHIIVASDATASSADLETALRFAPSSADATYRLAQAQFSIGQTDAALAGFRQAVALDPRSPTALERLARVLLMLRHYPEGREQAERGLSLASTDLSLIEDRMMSYIGEGDLAGARASLHNVPPTLDRGALSEYMANYWDLYWVLEPEDQRLVVALPYSAFDDDTANAAIVKAQVYQMLGDVGRMHAYADTGRRIAQRQVHELPRDAARQQVLMLGHAYLGDRDAAIREGHRVIELAEATRDRWGTIPYAYHVMARACALVGDRSCAVEQLRKLLSSPYFISVKWLAIDPTWQPLRTDPGFQDLLRGKEQPPPVAAR